MKRPRRLAPGATVAIVAPASGAADARLVGIGQRILEGMGFRVVLGRHVHDAHGEFAGTDADRAADLIDMLTQKDVDAVICVRGGNGALRTVAAIDEPTLQRLERAEPKVFVGFSDITCIHALLSQRLGWITFHGPMLRSLSARAPYVLEAFRRAVTDVAPFEIDPVPGGVSHQSLAPGVAEGPLCGGWLPAIVDLIGTPWKLDLRGRILFFEDVGRSLRDLDRMLVRLVLSGRMAGCAGVMVGELEGCGGDGGYGAIEPLLREILLPLGVPVLARLPLGHGPQMVTLPIGARAQLDADRGRLKIIEPGVA